MFFGVPVLVPGAQMLRIDRAVSGEFVDDLSALAFGAVDDGVRAQIAEVYRTEFSFDSVWLNTEASQFINRLSGSGVAVSAPFATSDMVRPISNDVKQSEQWFTVAPVVVPRAVAAGSRVAINLKIENQTDALLKATGADAGQIVISTLAVDGSPGAPAEKTRLLVDIEPGRTVPHATRLPILDRAGPVTLEVRLARGNITLATCRLSLDIVTGSDPLDTGWADSEIERSYNDDHIVACDLMKDWVDRYVDRPDPLLLELGGNFSPMIHWWPGPRINMDIDAHGILSHNLLRAPFGAEPERFFDVVGDGMRPPFRDGALDAVAMFATFHHFPDPAGLLAALKPKLSPGGIVMLMCEPVGHVFAETNVEVFVRELAEGVYEQSFAFWEYREMAESAGYQVIDTGIDHGSVKLALRPRVT